MSSRVMRVSALHPTICIAYVCALTRVSDLEPSGRPYDRSANRPKGDVNFSPTPLVFSSGFSVRG